MSGPEPAGLPTVASLVVRAWRESEDREAFRARVWWSRDLESAPMQGALVGSVEELETVVNQWLSYLRES